MLFHIGYTVNNSYRLFWSQLCAEYTEGGKEGLQRFVKAIQDYADVFSEDPKGEQVKGYFFNAIAYATKEYLYSRFTKAQWNAVTAFIDCLRKTHTFSRIF